MPRIRFGAAGNQEIDQLAISAPGRLVNGSGAESVPGVDIGSLVEQCLGALQIARLDRALQIRVQIGGQADGSQQGEREQSY